jgi:hypothetical protein
MMYSLYTLMRRLGQQLNINRLCSYMSLLKRAQLINLELKELLKSSSEVSPASSGITQLFSSNSIQLQIYYISCD